MREWYISGIACLIDQYIHFKSLKESKSLNYFSNDQKTEQFSCTCYKTFR